MLTTPHRKKVMLRNVHNCFGLRLMHALIQPKQWKMDMRFGTWNVRSLYRTGLLTTVTRKFARYKVDLVSVQKVRLD